MFDHLREVWAFISNKRHSYNCIDKHFSMFCSFFWAIFSRIERRWCSQIFIFYKKNLGKFFNFFPLFEKNFCSAFYLETCCVFSLFLKIKIQFSGYRPRKVYRFKEKRRDRTRWNPYWPMAEPIFFSNKIWHRL